MDRINYARCFIGIANQPVFFEENGAHGASKNNKNSKDDSKNKEPRMLFCKKCKGHGESVPLKKHSYRCPFINCQCESCNKVMSERVTVMLRRYRNHAAVSSLSFKPVRFSNGNIRFRVFDKGNCEDGIPFVDPNSIEATDSSPTSFSLPSSPTPSTTPPDSGSTPNPPPLLLTNEQLLLLSGNFIQSQDNLFFPNTFLANMQPPFVPQS